MATIMLRSLAGVKNNLHKKIIVYTYAHKKLCTILPDGTVIWEHHEVFPFELDQVNLARQNFFAIVDSLIPVNGIEDERIFKEIPEIKTAFAVLGETKKKLFAAPVFADGSISIDNVYLYYPPADNKLALDVYNLLRKYMPKNRALFDAIFFKALERGIPDENESGSEKKWKEQDDETRYH